MEQSYDFTSNHVAIHIRWYNGSDDDQKKIWKNKPESFLDLLGGIFDC